MRTLDKQVLDAALMYVNKGLPVFPVHHPIDKGCSCKNKSCNAKGKHPAIPNEPKGGLHHATYDEKQVRAWFGERGSRRGYNMAVACGMGYVCLDVDPKNGGYESFDQLVQDYEPLPDTWVEETGEDSESNRGMHYWFLIPGGVQLRSRKPLAAYPGIDLLANGSYAIVAPSAHISGVRYDTVTALDDVVDAPEWLIDLTEEEEEEDILLKGRSLAEPTGLRPTADIRKFLRKGGIPPGAQRAMSCKAARALWGIWVDAEDAADLIWQALQKCEWDDDPWTENQVLKLVRDEFSKQPKPLDKPPGVSLPTDLGRAYRLRHFARGNLAFSEDTADWYTWDSTAWRRNGGSAPKRMVEAMALEELQQAHLDEGDGAADRRKEAMRIQNLSNVRNLLGMTEFLDGVLVEDRNFDRDPFLLNAVNCVVDLKTGKSKEQERDYYMTRTCNTSYYEDAESDLWDEVVDAACQGNEALIDFLQLAFGYAATGDTREDAFFYLYGPGGTGKTTVLEAVSWVLGGYSAAADPETFMLQQNVGQTHRADLAALRHARLVTSTEIGRGARFSTSVLNRLTGRDTISARVPFAKAPLVFKPQWTLFFAANHFPAVPGATKRDGFWRRVKILPFENALKRNQMNPALGYHLSRDEHAQAVLKWVVDGAVRWWEEYGSKHKTMDVPDEVTHEIEEIQEQEDPLGDFIEMLVLDKDAVTPRRDVYDFYKDWCDRKGVHNMHPRSFTPALRSSLEGEGVHEEQMRHEGNIERCWVGVRLPLKKKGKMTI